MIKKIFQDLMEIKKPQKLGRFFLLSVLIHCLFIYGMMTVEFEPVKVNRNLNMEGGTESYTAPSSKPLPFPGEEFVEDDVDDVDDVDEEGELKSPPPRKSYDRGYDEGASPPRRVKDTKTPVDLTSQTRSGNTAGGMNGMSERNGMSEVKTGGFAGRDAGNGSVGQGYSYTYRARGGNSGLVDTDDYVKLYRKPFLYTIEKPRSSFSLKIGTLSYPRVRRAIKKRQIPEAEEVKIEEMVNYFKYDYPAPTGNRPIAVFTELAACPWNPSNRLLHIGLKGKVLFKDGLKNSRFTVARDVNIQVVFNPAKVTAYRLIGYGSRTPKMGNWNLESRVSGEMRAAQRITSLYEVVPVPSPGGTLAEGGEIGTVVVTYRSPDEAYSTDPSKVKTISHPVPALADWGQVPSDNFRFSAVVAQFGMMLSNSEAKDAAAIDRLLETARSAMGEDPYGYRADFIKLLERYRDILNEKNSNR